MESYDVIVAGAGAGGICAALAAARTGARTLLVEKGPEVGGTGVHSPVALVCKFHGSDHRPINLGIHRELFPEIYLHSTRDLRPTAKRLTYDEHTLLARYRQLISTQRRLEVRLNCGVKAARMLDRGIESITLEDDQSLSAKVYIDGTADAVLSSLAGMRTMKGRERDGQMQSATLTFSVEGIELAHLKDPDITTRGGMQSLLLELDTLYALAKQSGRTTNPRSSVMAFPYPDGKRILFNSNEVLAVDPCDPASMREARQTGERLVQELFAILQDHPAFRHARIHHISRKMGVREGPRVVGDYILTAEDCLGEARFSDMVAASAYEIDIHDPDGGATVIREIPGSGYYHIPYRCMVPADADNLLIASRCLSSTHEAHSSFRVISGVTAIGQAAGTAAALAARLGDGQVRAVRPEWIRHELRTQVQFVEGPVEPPPPPR